jgi:predicted TIM-barrel fold metal-dependent hydrolase
MHAHFVPTDLAEALRRRVSAPRIETLADGGERLHLPIGALAFGSEYVDMDARIAFMDRLGVDCQVLSFPGLFGVDSLKLAESEPLLIPFNDELAALCGTHPGRFLGLAALPFAHMDNAVAEYRRARTVLGLKGAILPVNGFVDLAEAEKFRPVFTAAQELGGLLFLHPGRRPDEVPATATEAAAPPFSDTMLPRQALDVQARVASAMVTLLFTDFLDPYPDVAVQVANLGGTLPMVIERMDHAARLRTPDDPVPSSRAGRVYVDCASLGPNAIETAVALYGADRVVLGTDCPIFRTDWTLEALQAARLTPAQRDLILHGNARTLLESIPRQPAAS